MLHDRYGNPVATTSRAALEKFDEACGLIRLYRGDPVAALDVALEHDPDFTMAWAVRAGLLVQATDKAYAEETERSIRAGFQGAKDDRARAHLAAAQAWSEGRFAEGITMFARIARENPRDLIALQAAHVGCFFIGRQADLRDWPVQALRAFRRGDDGYHAVLGMAAFGYEECGQYGEADAAGREAVELEPRDGWAVHAVAHVNEMRGDTKAGIPWLRDSADVWAPESGFSYHNFWHLALLHIDRGEFSEALKLYDEKVRPNPDAQVLLEWIDMSALLWRLYLEGADVGDRFENAANVWARAAEDGIYAFNDVHAIMAFLGAGRADDAARTIASMRRAIEVEGDNAAMTRDVGLPLAEALVAYSTGRYSVCVEKIAATRGIAQRFGGSHAQRDVFSLTAVHAALLGGMKSSAEALAAERLVHKPHSPWARKLAQSAAALPKQRAEAAA